MKEYLEKTLRQTVMIKDNLGVLNDLPLACSCMKGIIKKKKDKGKYLDVMLHIGYCYRDGIGVGRNRDKARECFNDAKTGIELRIKNIKASEMKLC